MRHTHNVTQGKQARSPPPRTPSNAPEGARGCAICGSPAGRDQPRPTLSRDTTDDPSHGALPPLTLTLTLT
ncbi:hypothetical protein, partial [Streptomyces europaeiscabiei]|uniref:hypothetical protein n=1 Tax=Streptomyces europaeiscabiei TaxID=146819 RepID=UPI0029C0794D